MCQDLCVHVGEREEEKGGGGGGGGGRTEHGVRVTPLYSLSHSSVLVLWAPEQPVTVFIYND